jgi:hypothetical protein
MPLCDELGPYSRSLDRGAIGTFIDGRSREGKFLRRYERMLIQHFGGSPSAVQKAMISRAARCALHLELMDERSLRDGHVFGTHDHNYYISWSNALARLLARLGIGPAEEPQQTQTLEDILRDIAARRSGFQAAEDTEDATEKCPAAEPFEYDPDQRLKLSGRTVEVRGIIRRKTRADKEVLEAAKTGAPPQAGNAV